MDMVSFDAQMYKVTIQIVLPLVLTAMGTMVSWLLKVMKDKYTLDIKMEREEWILWKVEDAIRLAAENSALKQKLEGTGFTSNEKLQTAINFVMAKVPEMTREQAADYIQSVLAKTAGEGATKDEIIVF